MKYETFVLYWRSSIGISGSCSMHFSKLLKSVVGIKESRLVEYSTIYDINENVSCYSSLTFPDMTSVCMRFGVGV